MKDFIRSDFGDTIIALISALASGRSCHTCFATQVIRMKDVLFIIKYKTSSSLMRSVLNYSILSNAKCKALLNKH